jgi:hypothetical protein
VVAVHDPVAVAFAVPEAVGPSRDGDPDPPLTHVIRHFVAGWLAFPLLYGVLGTFGAKALDFPRWWAVGALLAVLGWITTTSCSRTSRSVPPTGRERPEDVDPRPSIKPERSAR